MAVCFDEQDVRPMGRTAVGVRGIRLREGDYVVGAGRAAEGRTVLSITENGYGKRTPVEEYRITNRGGLGIKNYMVTEKTGPVVGIKVVEGGEDLLLVTQAGILIRTHVDTIRTAGRATQGRHCHALQGGWRQSDLPGTGRPGGGRIHKFRENCGKLSGFRARRIGGAGAGLHGGALTGGDQP